MHISSWFRFTWLLHQECQYLEEIRLKYQLLENTWIKKGEEEAILLSKPKLSQCSVQHRTGPRGEGGWTAAAERGKLPARKREKVLEVHMWWTADTAAVEERTEKSEIVKTWHCSKSHTVTVRKWWLYPSNLLIFHLCPSDNMAAK